MKYFQKTEILRTFLCSGKSAKNHATVFTVTAKIHFVTLIFCVTITQNDLEIPVSYKKIYKSYRLQSRTDINNY